MGDMTATKTNRKDKIKLAYGESIIAVIPEHASGPGWTNSILWIHIRTADGRLRTESLQPEEQTREQRVLFGTLAAAHVAMVKWTMEVVESGNSSDAK